MKTKTSLKSREMKRTVQPRGRTTRKRGLRSVCLHRDGHASSPAGLMIVARCSSRNHWSQENEEADEACKRT